MMATGKERRFGERVAIEMPVAWYRLDQDGDAAIPCPATCVDVSSSGICFVTEREGRRGEGIAVHLTHQLLEHDVVLPAWIVRVSRDPGGFRLAAQFEDVDVASRAVLGRFVVAALNTHPGA